MKKYYNKIKRHFHDVLQIKTTPHEIALGFALGTFIAIFPTFGLGALIGILLVFIFKKISKISLFSALAIWNPFVLIPIYGVGYKIGNFLLKDVPLKTYKFYIFQQIYIYSRRVFLGNIILAVIVSLISYVVLYYFVRYYQKNHPVEKIVEAIDKEIKKIERSI